MSMIDKIRINGTTYDIGGSGGSGELSSDFIFALQELYYGVAVWDSEALPNPQYKIDALSAFIDGGGDDPTPPGEITVTFSNGVLTITGVSYITNKSYNNGVLSLT